MASSTLRFAPTYVLLIALAAPALAAERLPIGEDLGFEEPEPPAPRRGPWRPGNASSLVSSDDHDPADGARCLRLGVADGADFAAVQQRFPASAFHGQRLLLRGRLRTEEVAGGFAGLWLRLDGDEGVVAFDNMADRGVTGTTPWTTYEIPMIVPTSARSMTFGVLLVGRGVVWADDLAFEAAPRPERAPSPDASALLEEAIAAMAAHSINRERVAWDDVRGVAALLAMGAEQPADVHAAVRHALEMLGDRHSFLMEARDAEAIQDEGSVEEEMAALEARGLMPRGEMLPGGAAYVYLPAYGGLAPEASRAFARRIQEVLRRLDAEHPCGYVVDLRGNGGGNMWPMLAGIGPLVGEGRCGAFVAPGGETTHWRYDAGAARIEGAPESSEDVTSVADPVALAEPAPAVAVLTGRRTASSGEAIVTAFRARPRTRSFGSPTAGMSTANDTITLCDGSMLALTVSTFADRAGTIYGGPIAPDEDVLAEAAPGTSLADDPVVAAARRWLDEGACAS